MNRIKIKEFKRVYFCYILFLVMLSVSFLLMPFGIGSDGQIKSIIYFIGVLFWIGLIGVIVTSIRIRALGKTLSEKNEDNVSKKNRIGVLCFFQNKPAMIVDAVMIVSLIVLIILFLFSNSAILKFILISIFVFSFGMHCILNGSNYSYIANSNNRGREREL